MRLTLRKKLLVFSVAIAVLPLLIAGGTLIRIARDELKSSANDQLVTTARQITDEIDNTHRNAWLAPLSLIANAIDDDKLGVEAKIALLTLGIGDLADIAALQITVEGRDQPLLVTRESLGARLTQAGLDPAEVLRIPAQRIDAFLHGDTGFERMAQQVAGTDIWLATVVLPLRRPLAGGRATLSARIDLSPLRDLVRDHPFAKTGTIILVDRTGRRLFGDGREDLRDFAIVAEAVELIPLQSRLVSVKPYARPDGEAMLGALSFPEPFDWAVITEKSERAAYFTITVMIQNLMLWVSAGLIVAGLGALAFALGISRPILKIGQAAIEVGKGNFQARVQAVRSRDEIGDLASRINEMIVQINERFQLAKFVSHGTIHAIQGSDHGGVKLGGSRRRVAIVFADIRGYTAFSESREPEVVVEVLNHYFANQGEAVARHNGDIDKFVGDQLMAVFQGPAMCEDAVRCALEIQDIMLASAREHPDWKLDIGIGIDAGEVVVGAMGSPERMDYTVLGDHVNLAARLCSAAEPRQTIVSDAVRQAVGNAEGFAFAALEPIRVKGKSEPIRIYAVDAAGGARDQAMQPSSSASVT
ncbi:adenylate/guanylate cyclase domain-containing protein [Polymorphum gilvum]|uniref:Adenylate/guanylate cyclase n=1 Tax=Polymorphum gilvum (strain LMG 25793 / CGMCC 1.9160 / SL003B-26A1) TaxID=991905 RepID=F2J1S6_POLGS|nr:adenylate/guanylate cyclase domain-containing protein [Polymorphum gilvum]ADZ71987.1 Adenylate/guanylate cyclase [Polymorphum gilvum SL003B-26A1]